MRESYAKNYGSAALRGEGGANPDRKVLTAHGSAVAYGWLAQDLSPEGAIGDALDADAERGEIILDRAAEHLKDVLLETIDADVGELLRAGPLNRNSI